MAVGCSAGWVVFLQGAYLSARAICRDGVDEVTLALDVEIGSITLVTAAVVRSAADAAALGTVHYHPCQQVEADALTLKVASIRTCSRAINSISTVALSAGVSGSCTFLTVRVRATTQVVGVWIWSLAINILN